VQGATLKESAVADRTIAVTDRGVRALPRLGGNGSRCMFACAPTAAHQPAYFHRAEDSRQFEGSLMNIITWLAIGGLVGWLVSVAMRIDAQEKIFLNVAVGSAGAVFSGWFLSPLLDVSSSQGNLSVGGVIGSLLGAVILLAAVTLIRGGIVR